MHRCQLLAVAALLAVATAASAGTVYKWTAPDGSVTYGEFPPPGVDASPLDGPPTRSGSPGPGDGEPAETGNGGETTEPTTADDETSPSADPEAERQIAEACEAARRNQAVLADPSVRRIQVDGGEAQILTPDEREARLAETREFLDTWCTDG